MTNRSSTVFAVAIICTLAFYLLASVYLPPGPAAEATSSTETRTTTASLGTTNSTKSTTAVSTNQTTSESSSAETLPLNGSAIYSKLGYPILTYDGDSQYSPSKPNFTLGYQSNPAFSVGWVEIPAINITQAVHLAEDHAGLSKADYSLVDADFDPGTIVNNTMRSPAVWNLGFARVYDGYWLYGSADDNGATNLVSVDAISGSILKSSSSPGADLTLGNYTFRVSASRALASVRGLDLLNLPAGLTKNGNVTSVDPRIVKLGLSPHTFYLYAPANGQYRPCWRISLSYETSYDPLYPWQTVFYIDGQSGGLLAASSENVFQPGSRTFVSTSFVSSSAQNLTVSQETFQMNTSIAGFPHSVTVEVPNVVVVRPGLIGSIPINFSYNGPAYVVASLDFYILPTDSRNPPPVGLPPGGTISFSDNAVAVNATTSTTRTIFFAVEGDARPGTYLVIVSPVHADAGLFAQLPFLLTIWNGTGEWPPPPSVG
jgi:hypothetical protein